VKRRLLISQALSLSRILFLDRPAAARRHPPGHVKLVRALSRRRHHP
jgi:hypothetical protein